MVATLKTERLTLRAPRPSDAGLISLYAGDERLARMTSSIPHPYPPGAAEAFVAAQLAGKRAEDVWVIDATRSAGEELIGVIGLKAKDAEIGYWIGQPFWNTGYASEALQAVLQHLFEERGLDEVSAMVFEENAISAHVLEKAGFRRTGQARGYSVARGAEVALLTFSCRWRD